MGRRTLLLGRSGAGKTRALTVELSRYLGDGRGRDALLLVPNLSQASHLKRLLLTRLAVPGFFDESILTFTSLAERILPDLPIGGLLSGLRRDLVLRRALTESPPPAFRRVARYPGFRRAALAFLKELKQNGLAPEEVESHLERMAAERTGAPRERLLAFRALFEAYEGELRMRGLVDHEDYLRRARDALAAGMGRLDLAFLGVDGFQNFTRLEREIVLLLAGQAERTVATLAYHPALERAEGGPFRVAHETYLFLQEHGFVRETLDENRRARSPSLARFVSRLAEPEDGEAPPDGSVRVLEGADPKDEADDTPSVGAVRVLEGADPKDEADDTPSVGAVRVLEGADPKDEADDTPSVGAVRVLEGADPKDEADDTPSVGAVRVLEGADPADEADRVAREVLRRVREEGLRYRDVVVVFREVHRRRDLFRAAFARHRIPHRFYGSEPVARFPFARSALHLLRITAGELTRERVLALLRADHLPGVSHESVDRLEDDLLEHGDPDDGAGWVERVRVYSDEGARALEDLVAFEIEPSDPRGTARSVLGLVERRLEPLWSRDLSDADRVRAEAAAFEAVRSAVTEVGDALGDGGAAAGLPEFVDLLVEVLRDARVSARDRRLDVVNLIDAREARQWEAPVVVVSGLVEGEFPQSPREDVFLPDEDRRRENRDGGLALRERLLERDEERYLFHVALTRARDRLVLTYPATDGTGEKSLRSLFVEDAISALGGEQVVSRRPLSDPLPREEETADRADLRRRALLGMGEPYREGTREEERARRASALHDLLVAAPDAAYRHAVRIGERFLPGSRAALADPSRIVERHPPDRGWSASALQDFVQCPFLHFAHRTLSLQESPRAASDALDPLLLGEIAHEVLRVAFLNVLDGEPLPGPEHLDRIYAEVFEEKAGGAASGLVEARVARELSLALHRVVEQERRRLRASTHRPVHLEESFGPRARPLRVETGDGRVVQLAGRVDRIDVGPGGGAVLIDYKYSKSGFEKHRQDAEEGAHLQLPIYLLALEDAFGLRPEGAWLYPLKDPRTSGYALEGGPEPDRPVPLDDEGLVDLLARTRETVDELTGRILAGEIDVSPRKLRPCTRCAYADLCRFEEGRGDG